ncbi:MAG: Fur family transcriptional regulator [Planctomycetaceae bacterium]
MARSRRPDSEACRSRIRAAGLRCTAARLAVLEHLEAARGPRTHADVSAALSSRGFDRATIYRNLTELTEARLLDRVEVGDHVWRFEIRRQHDHSGRDRGHPHFLCTTCGTVSCLDDVRVAITPATAPVDGAPRRRDAGRRAGIGTVTEVLLKGRCGDCG